jgi:hypothetical protein
MKYITASKLKKFREENKGPICPILENKLEDVVVDHDHDNGQIRGCIDRQANAWEGKCRNAWIRYCEGRAEVSYAQGLMNLSQYIKGDPYELLHPKGVTDLCKRFGRLTKDKQVFALKLFKYKTSEINACNNTRERIKLYRQFLTQNKYE